MGTILGGGSLGRFTPPAPKGRWPSNRPFDRTHVGATKDFGRHDECSMCGAPGPRTCKGCTNLVEYASNLARRLIDFIKAEGEEVSFNSVDEAIALITANRIPVREYTTAMGEIVYCWLRQWEMPKRVIYLSQFRDAMIRFGELVPVAPPAPAAPEKPLSAYTVIRVGGTRQSEPATKDFSSMRGGQ